MKEFGISTEQADGENFTVTTVGIWEQRNTEQARSLASSQLGRDIDMAAGW